ncbi:MULTISPECIES: thioredoxin family protein [unclassified Blastococcus]
MPAVPTTDATFARDVLESPLPVLVDFGAEWCPPCRVLAPTIDRLADEQAGRLRVVTLDVDANPETTRRYQVMGLPTMGLFVRGELVTTLVGGRPGWAIVEALAPYLPVPA